MIYIKLTIVFVLFLSSTEVTYSQIDNKNNYFNEIVVFGRLNVRLEKSNSDSVFIKSDNIDINSIKYYIKDSVLNIKLLSDLPKSNKTNITILFQELNSLKVSAGVKIYNLGTIKSKKLNITAKSGSEIDLLINVDSLKVKVIEKAFVRLTGVSNYMDLKTSTKGDFRSVDLENKITRAVLNGGSAEINVTDYLNATVRNGASLRYLKLPERINKKETLGGTVDIIEDL